MTALGNARNAYIFGAKSVAIGICRAIKELNPEVQIIGFMVSLLENNPKELDGLAVREIGEISAELSEEEKSEVFVYIAVPEVLHKQIINNLLSYGFKNYKPVDSRMEADLMERYYKRIGRFPSLHQLSPGKEKAELSIYLAQFYKDKKLENPPIIPNYIRTILLGCDGNPDKQLEDKVDCCDNTGDHISFKNPDYCEMTAFYWVWKNELFNIKDYVGICHYRRLFDITEEDKKRLSEHDVDVILPFPMIHLPDIREHHGRYMQEIEWETMLEALHELYPDYAKRFDDIFSGIYLYNYNLVIAKKKIFEKYCAWVFPLLFRTEELCILKGVKRTARYLAYMSESLLAFYFIYHEELKIYHTGRLLFT